MLGFGTGAHSDVMRAFVASTVVVSAVLSLVHLAGCSRGPVIADYFGGKENVEVIAQPDSVTAWRTVGWVKGETYIFRS